MSICLSSTQRSPMQCSWPFLLRYDFVSQGPDWHGDGLRCPCQSFQTGNSSEAQRAGNCAKSLSTGAAHNNALISLIDWNAGTLISTQKQLAHGFSKPRWHCVCCVLTRPLLSTSSASLALQGPTCQWSLVGDTGWESQNQWPRLLHPSQPTNRNFHLFVWLTSEPRWQNHSEGYPRCRFHSLASWATSEFLAQHLDPRIPHCSHDTVCQKETPGQQRLWWAARVTQLLPIYMQFWGHDSSPVKRKPRVMLDMFRKVISSWCWGCWGMLRWYPACFGYLGNTIETSGPTFSPSNLLGSPRWIRALGHQKGLAAWDGNVAAMCRSCCW